MRKWCKKLGVVGGCLLGLAGLHQPVDAQFGAGPPAGGGIFAGEPQQPTPPDFPNPGGSTRPEQVSPFSMRDDGAPNAFTCLEGPPPMYTYGFTFRTEYLGWFISPIRVPAALVTSSTASPLTTTDFGALGQPSTTTLVGPGNYNSNQLMNGGRVTMGLAPGFMPPIEVSGLFFARNSTLFNGQSNGDVTLARPVQLVNAPTLTGAPGQSAVLVAGPGFGSGGVNVTDRINLWGIDTDMFWRLTDNGVIQFDLITGYKYIELDERFNINTTSTAGVPVAFNAIPGGVPPGLTVNTTDSIFARSQFNGGTLGLRNRINWGRFMLMTDAKLSLGSTYQYVPITGTTTLVGAGGAAPATGGVLALPTNAYFSQHEFSIIPAVNMNLSYQVTPSLRFFVGYSVLAWTNVVRAANQIQTAIDPVQVPSSNQFVPNTNASAPLNTGQHSTFWANGFNAGFEFGF